MKKLDEQIKRIKELMFEETLYGKNIDLITESNVTPKLKKLVLNIDADFLKLRTELNSNTIIIKNFNAYEWATNVTENIKKLKELPNINTNPKITEVNKILSDNKKIMDDITEYFKTLEIDPSKSKPENTKLFNDISMNLPALSNNIEQTKKLLMLPSNKLKEVNIKFISEMTGYDIDAVKKLLTTISDAKKQIKSSINTSKKIISATAKWYTEDQSNTFMRVMQTMTPFNFKQAFRGKAPWLKTFGYVVAQGWIYGWLYKTVRCELFGDKETNDLITSWGPEELSLWEKYQVNSLSEIVESINENPITEKTLNFVTGGFIEAIASDCEKVDESILQKLVDDGKINSMQAHNISILGMNYMKKKGFDKYIENVKGDIKDAKESIKTGGKDGFNDAFKKNEGWYE